METKKSLKSIGYILTAFIAAVVAVTVLTFGASAEKISGDYRYYSYSDGTASITGYTGTATELVIPSEIDGYKVIAIDNYAFRRNGSLKNITIPEGVAYIGQRAFSDCDNLRNIVIPDTVISIEESAFLSCDNLTSINIPNNLVTICDSVFEYCIRLTSITIPDSVTSISYSAFSGCSSLTSIVIPDSVNSIGDFVFSGCTSLTSVKLPNNITSLEMGTFKNCSSLTRVAIPDSVTSIGAFIFSGCTSLTDISVSENNTKYKSENGVLFTKDGKTIVVYPAGKNDTSYIIPNNVTKLGQASFEYCKNLTSITVSENVTDITLNCFEGCEKLESINVSENNKVYKSENGILFGKDGKILICYPAGKTDESYTIPDSVIEIETGAFGGCKNLKSVTIPNNVKIIGSSAFSSTGLTSIVIPDNVTTISSFAFSDCANLKNITIPEGVTYIGMYAFSGCESLDSVIIPSSVTDIEDFVFSSCGSLKSVTLQNDLQSIGSHSFYKCKSLTDVTIPESVTYIATGAFSHCTSLTDIPVAENNTTYKSENGVLFTKNGKTIVIYPCGKTENKYVIPDSVTKIGDSAFGYCDNLTSITIPVDITRIGQYAFEGCKKLTDVYYKGSEEQWSNIEIDTYNDPLKNSTIHYNYVDHTELVSAFVDRLYVILLNRNAEAEGLADWTNRLTSGTASSAEIVYGIANSQEFANRGLSNEDIVETMYQAMLGRASDEGGKANWLNCLNSGMTVTGIINGFSGSTEFGNICAQYGIQAGAITTCEARDRNNGLTLFVSRMYTKALNRPYDVTGLNDWTNRYLTGEAKVSDIAFGFIFSPEFVGKNLSNSDYVDTLYRTFFNREPDEGGKSNWMNQLASGTAREDVLNGFVGSQECINLVATFGI